MTGHDFRGQLPRVVYADESDREELSKGQKKLQRYLTVNFQLNEFEDRISN